MWKQLSLRTRLLCILAAMVLITLMGGSVMVWYTYQIGALFKQVVWMDLKAVETAGGLENALANQKGFVTYYLQDRDPKWLEKLKDYRKVFDTQLLRAQALAVTEDEKKVVEEIAFEYSDYIRDKDLVIAYYQAGDLKAGSELHKKVRDHFFDILALCGRYKNLGFERIERVRVHTETQGRRLRIIAGTAIWTVVVLGALMAFVLVFQILNPLRSLAGAEDNEGELVGNGNEVKAVRQRLHSLEEDIGEAKTQLERSQEYLLQSEKLALVGKLAAGMAHSIRNPMTSVKMRLFSLGRSLDMTETQKEDFDVISEEIRHLDNIVGNFLEFSRPPKLRKQSVSPSDVVDMAVALLRQRLESYGAEVKIERSQSLPTIPIDPEQLKEVFVNLLLNACESTGGKVRIVVSEEQTALKPWGDCVVIRVKDDGPGIPEAVRDRVFDPFFSTKEEGTGLGLSISDRILNEHGGRLSVESKEGEGATFVIVLPKGELQIE